ncbi:MAG: hypothetical protein Q7R87_00305 [Nanoarchaeota archaeon]|nr:hypothetical protein [Nanoarchaeota archaeon]
MADKSRPGGVIFVSVLNFLAALWGISGVVFMIMLANEFSNNSPINLDKDLFFLVTIGLNSILLIVGGIGLLLRKKWAWILSIIAGVILALTFLCFTFLSFKEKIIVLAIICIVLAIISLLNVTYLLTSKRVREYISN